MSPGGIDIGSVEPFMAAAVQAAPVYLDATATVEKACGLIEQAAGDGARIIAFPEVFVPGYPYWNWVMSPLAASPMFEELFLASIDVPGPEVERLCAAAAAHRIHVVIGVNERDANSAGTIYNSVLVIDDKGTLLGVHRKLVPTWAEKLTWGFGDGSSLRVYPTGVGPLGVLACGENTNPLARFSLLAQGELVHVMNYIALPVAPAGYDMSEAIALRARAHCFEGKVFTIVSCSTIDQAIIEKVAGEDQVIREMFQRPNSALSGICDPTGKFISDVLIDEEGITYAEIDLRQCIQPKQMHDIVGHYNRFDIFDLQVDARPWRAIGIDGSMRPVSPTAEPTNPEATLG